MKNKLFLFITTLLITKFSYAQYAEVYPSNWWVGMKNQQLQLLVYGEGIGSATPVISYPGVKLEKVNKADSPDYLFLDLRISPATKLFVCRLLQVTPTT